MSGFGIFCAAWFIGSLLSLLRISDQVKDRQIKGGSYSPLLFDFHFLIMLIIFGLIPQLLVAIYKLSIYVYSI